MAALHKLSGHKTFALKHLRLIRNSSPVSWLWRQWATCCLQVGSFLVLPHLRYLPGLAGKLGENVLTLPASLRGNRWYFQSSKGCVQIFSHKNDLVIEAWDEPRRFWRHLSCDAGFLFCFPYRMLLANTDISFILPPLACTVSKSKVED